jgi:N-acetylmuramoyl-L-alanine amidase
MIQPIEAPSPNFDARRAPPDMIVLHYTGMQTGEAAIARLRDPEAKVSAHYVVEEDGARVPPRARSAPRLARRQVVLERRDRHQRRLHRRGDRQPWARVGLSPFPDTQIAAVTALLTDMRERWTVPDGRIIGHSDVAPARKEDPGELFPWKRLAEAGHGVWAEPAPAPGPPLTVGDEGPGVLAMQGALRRLGYDATPTGRFSAEDAVIVTAFQRHWRQDRVDGVADGETRARLVAVLRAAQALGPV